MNFITFPMAVGDSVGFIGFDSMGSASKISSNKKQIVPMVSLDEIINGYNPTYIKMDIEGAEKKAIEGARKTIEIAKPYLAISIYHHPEDLWEIPLFIKENFPFYNLFIRIHGHFGMETVLYCVPN